MIEQVLGLDGQTDQACRELHLLDLHLLGLFGALERTAEQYQALLTVAGFAWGVVHVTTTPWQVIEAAPA